MTTLRNRILLIISFSLLVIGCSKKDLPSDSVPANNATGTTKTTYELLDSIFLYAKQLYYWNTSLPTYSAFQPRNYNTSVNGNDSAKGKKEIFDLSRYAINSSTGKSYEYYADDTADTKYSYLESKNADLNGGEGYKSNVTLLGWGNDLGVAYPIFLTDSIFVFRLFYDNGPADMAGLTRGNCYVTAVNNKKFSVNSQTDITYLNNALSASSINLTYLDTLSVSHNITLSQKRYSSNPIFSDTVITVGSKTIGYFALLNFADQTVLKTSLTNLFTKFNSKGVTDLVVDLRYNGGGMVETSEQLANLIAPSSLSGKKMFYENYNTLMQSGQATMLKNIPQDDDPSKSYFDYSWTSASTTANFNASASGNLQLNNVCFIVSSGTASASELLINNLTPYMNVKLIGASDSRATNGKPATTTTYGKPVGFFAIPIGAYDVYIPEFESRNSLDKAVSYSGMTCDISDFDDPYHNFGDHREDAFAQAISYITSGNFLTTTTTVGGKSTTSNTATNTLKVLMSRSGGSSSSSSLSVLKAFNTTINPVQKGMVETFKTINRNK